MPNWCNNTVTFSHEDPEMIRRVVDGFKGKGMFTQFVPMPVELVETESPAPTRTEEDRERNRRLLAQHGYHNWYDWAQANWGTKWDVTQKYNGDPVVTDDGLSVSISFDSAWNPPLAFYDKMEGLGFGVLAFYHEPGMAFCGRYQEGDECYTIQGNSDWVEQNIPSDINEAMGIAEAMEQWEDDSSEPENTDETTKEIEA